MQQNQLPGEAGDPQYDDYRLPEEIDEKGALDRFADAIISPSEAFEGVDRSPRRSKIIVWGIVICSIAALVATALFYANPDLIDSLLTKQIETFDKKYEAGEMTEEQRDNAVEMVESSMKGEGAMKMLPYVTAPPVQVLFAVIGALALYTIARTMQRDGRDVNYSTALATYLIALMIPNLEKIVYALGMYLTGDVNFSLDPNILVRSEEMGVKYAMALVGPFTLWWIFVIGTGIAAITGASRTKAMVIWAIVHAVYGAVGVALAAIVAGMT